MAPSMEAPESISMGPSATSNAETAFRVWPGSAVLAHHLVENAEELQLSMSAVLELGSGTGLAGLTAAAALQLPTTLTDLQEVLPQLSANVKRNSAVLDDITVNVAELDWIQARRASTLPKGLEGPWSLVIAADCVWAIPLVEPFVDTLSLVCGPSTTALLAYTSRSGLCDKVLSNALAQHRFMVTPLHMPAAAAQTSSWITTALLYKCCKAGIDEEVTPFDFEAHLIETGILVPDYMGKDVGLRCYDLSLPYFSRIPAGTHSQHTTKS